VASLIAVHKDDACTITPPADAEVLTQRLRNAAMVGTLGFTGGSTPLQGPCDATLE
jgi:hypothetical protein